MSDNQKPTTAEDIWAVYDFAPPAEQRRFRGMLARRDRDRFQMVRYGLVHSYLNIVAPPARTLEEWRHIRDHLATLYPALLARKWCGDLQAADPGKPISADGLRDGYKRWLRANGITPPAVIL